MWSAYLAIGDSASKGVGDDVGALRCRSWTELLAEGLASDSPELKYRNVAYRGATAPGILRMQLPHLQEFGPDLVSVTVGANDARDPKWTAGAFSANFSAILAAIDDAGAQSMVATYPDIRSIFEQLGRNIRPSWKPYFERVREVNRIIREAGRSFDSLLVDLEWSEAATDPQYLSSDFTHPNAIGYRLAARTALEAIEERKSRPRELQVASG